MIPTSIIPAKKRVRRKRKQVAQVAGPAALTLVAGSYATFTVVLSFDRAIDVSAIDTSVIYVGDPDRGKLMQGGGDVSLVDPNTVAISMGEVDDYGGDTTLFASAESGIVAVDDGGTWAGTSGTGLPFP